MELVDLGLGIVELAVEMLAYFPELLLEMAEKADAARSQRALPPARPVPSVTEKPL